MLGTVAASVFDTWDEGVGVTVAGEAAANVAVTDFFVFPSGWDWDVTHGRCRILVGVEDAPHFYVTQCSFFHSVP